MINVPIDEKDGRFLADGLGTRQIYSVNVVPSVGRSRVLTTVTLKPGKTLVEDIAVK